MTLRRKFILALIGMVVFMALVFTVIALESTQSLMGHAESYIQQAFADRLIQLTGTYYENHSGWAKLQDYVQKTIVVPDQKFGRPPRDPQRFLVFDQGNQVVADPARRDFGKQLMDLPNNSLIMKQWQGIKINGKLVGHYWQEQRPSVLDGRLGRTIGASIIQAMLIGLILTSLVALLLGLALTRHFTEPLNRLMEGVRQVGKGQLSSRVEVKGNGDISVLARDFNRMTEQLARNEEVRRNMVADIAHELRTPLAVILGKLESIQEGVLPSTPETILPIQDETLRLIRLVRDLQQLSLAEAGKLPMSLRPVNIRKILEKIMEQFAIEFEERGLQGEIVGAAPRLIGDEDRLTQVFVNLIGNALLHTPPGGSLRVLLAERDNPFADSLSDDETTRRLRDVFWRKGEKAADETNSAKHSDDYISGGAGGASWVQVTVEDSGEGIPKEELEHIFDRFYRVDKARERESGGTGLGLAIAKEFIQAHGGFIQAESQLGVGSCFRVLLPLTTS